MGKKMSVLRERARIDTTVYARWGGAPSSTQERDRHHNGFESKRERHEKGVGRGTATAGGEIIGSESGKEPLVREDTPAGHENEVRGGESIEGSTSLALKGGLKKKKKEKKKKKKNRTSTESKRINALTPS